MQSLKIPPQYRIHQTPVARVSPLFINQQYSNNDLAKKSDHDDGWISCEELETIEKRFTDLLQEPNEKKPIVLNNYQTRVNSCDRLTLDEKEFKPGETLPLSLSSEERFIVLVPCQSFDDQIIPLPASLIYDNNPHPRPQTPHQFPVLNRTVLSANDILKVESSYRSIGTQVLACRCLCDLYVTTAERLSKLEDWLLFQHGLPVWLLNSGTNPKRQSRLSLIIAEHGSGFPIWQDTINEHSDVKQARAQHITFRLSDQNTLAVLRFQDLTASKEFFSFYRSIRNDSRYEHLFSPNKYSRSSSCSSIARKRRKNLKNIPKSSISNPCQFQHITSLQIKDRAQLISLNQCLIPTPTFSNQHI